ncbi:MAG: F0F1 ATP synthase subunit gamma [Candidatus Omnitrophota bacterium]
MATISEVKKDIEFYRDFASLIEVLKAIASFQFHALEKRIWTFGDCLKALESFFDFVDVRKVRHPFVNIGGRPQLVIAVTSDSGLLGGLNRKVIAGALGQFNSSKDRLVVVGSQGQGFVKGLDLRVTPFDTVDDDNRHVRAMELRNLVLNESLKGACGPVKIVYPYAVSLTVQRVVELPLLPCTRWAGDYITENASIYHSDVIVEGSIGDIVEYLSYLWIGYKLYEILQFARLAEHAARVIHLEESSYKIKDINKKLHLRYARVRHEIIDQQMRELFAARSIYVKR